MGGKHHYLPQFYLKGFCNEQDKLIVCRTKYKTFNVAMKIFPFDLNK